MSKEQNGSPNILDYFDYQHKNPPAPFNPDYIPYAKDVGTIATANCYRTGVYENPNKVERAATRMNEYERLMALGKPTTAAVQAAKQYIYEL